MTNAIYIHIPFCESKCGYCDFFSYKANPEEINQYIEVLRSEILQHATKKVTIDSVYIGGGTPSSISSTHIENILAEVTNNYAVSPSAEVTIELNPESTNSEKLHVYKKAGINRLSIGIQSYCDEKLKQIKRCRDRNVVEVMNSAIKLFDNVSVDLMFNLPGQTIEDLILDISQIPEDVSHVSFYSLSIEKETPLSIDLEKGQLTLPTTDIQIFMQEKIIEDLRAKGFDRYEISNYAKEGKQSRHNMHYWSGDDYFAFGAAAVSTIQNKRTTNTRNMGQYLKGNYIASVEELSKKIKEQEFIMLSFRKTEGINIKLYKKRFNIDFKKKYQILIDKWSPYLVITTESICLNTKGFHVFNEIVSDFF